jgi:hypothetical protein
MIGMKTGGDFYCTPVIGYRLWLVTEKLELTGCIHPVTWPEAEHAVAECQAPIWPIMHNKLPQHAPNVVPVKECGCGFYGFWDYPTLQASKVCYSDHIQTVRGVVAGWGKVWTAERGWRAKYAQPLAFLHWPERRSAVRDEFLPEHYEDAFKWNEIVAKTAEKHNVPIVHSPAELHDAAMSLIS